MKLPRGVGVMGMGYNKQELLKRKFHLSPRSNLIDHELLGRVARGPGAIAGGKVAH